MSWERRPRAEHGVVDHPVPPHKIQACRVLDAARASSEWRDARPGCSRCSFTMTEDVKRRLHFGVDRSRKEAGCAVGCDERSALCRPVEPARARYPHRSPVRHDHRQGDVAGVAAPHRSRAPSYTFSRRNSVSLVPGGCGNLGKGGLSQLKSKSHSPAIRSDSTSPSSPALSTARPSRSEKEAATPHWGAATPAGHRLVNGRVVPESGEDIVHEPARLVGIARIVRRNPRHTLLLCEIDQRRCKRRFTSSRMVKLHLDSQPPAEHIAPLRQHPRCSRYSHAWIFAPMGPDAGPVKAKIPVLRSATSFQLTRGRPRFSAFCPFTHPRRDPTRAHVTRAPILRIPSAFCAKKAAGRPSTLSSTPTTGFNPWRRHSSANRTTPPRSAVSAIPIV